MNKGLNYSEKLEAYIRKELTESERLEFEEQLRQDPLLQNELTLQQDIVSAICDYRKNELKQRLNKIDVRGGKNSPGDFTVGGAILGGIAIVGVAGFLIFKDSGKEMSATQLSSSASHVPYSSGETTAAGSMATDNEDTAATIADGVADTDSNTAENIAPATKSATENKTTAPKKNKVTTPVPVVVEPNQLVVKEEEIQKDDQLAMPENTPSSLSASADPTLIIVDNNSSRYKLHYKYINDQLFLYGFDKPYKIFDLPNQTQRYLLYDGNFYKLKRNQPQIAPIQKVENQDEIKSLEAYRTSH